MCNNEETASIHNCGLALRKMKPGERGEAGEKLESRLAVCEWREILGGMVWELFSRQTELDFMTDFK